MENSLKYKKICFSVDLSQYSYAVGKKALSLPLTYDFFMVLHVIEPPVVYTHAFAEFNELLMTLKSHAQHSMNAYLSSLTLPPEAGIIEMGTTKNTIIDFIKENQIDLLILGNRGLGGSSHLMGSTASFVVANAPCDVWIINIENISKQELTPSTFANIAQAYPSEFIKNIHPKTSSSAAITNSNKFGIKQHPIFSGSEKGVAQDISRGPHLTIRPKGAPTKGQSRKQPPKEEDGNK